MSVLCNFSNLNSRDRSLAKIIPKLIWFQEKFVIWQWRILTRFGCQTHSSGTKRLEGFTTFFRSVSFLFTENTPFWNFKPNRQIMCVPRIKWRSWFQENKFKIKFKLCSTIFFNSEKIIYCHWKDFYSNVFSFKYKLIRL